MGMRLFTLAALAAFFVSAPPVAAHGPYGWVMDNPLTAYCCGPEDCKPVAAREVRYLRGRWFVNGRPVPAGNVHLSGAPDAHYHACFADPPAMTEPRCLFIPGMS